MGTLFSSSGIQATISEPHLLGIEAGKQALLCTVRVSLQEKLEICPRNHDLLLPRPYCVVKSAWNSSSDEELGWLGWNVEESCEERTARSKVFCVSVYAMKTGKRNLEISFPHKNVLIESGNLKIAFTVYPSIPYSLQLKEVKGERSGKHSNLCCGSIGYIYVVAFDQYGNMYDRDSLCLSLYNQDAIQLISTLPVLHEKGTYELMIKCLKIGAVVCEIGFTGMASPLQVAFEVFDESVIRRVLRRSVSAT